MALKRVVSLLPSATELLCAIPGGEALLVARSHECDFPASIKHLPTLTAARIDPSKTSAEIDAEVKKALAESKSLYFLDTDGLNKARPDVILTQDLCDVCSIDLMTVERVASKMNPRPTVLSLNPMSMSDVLQDLVKVGEVCDLKKEAEK
eukprot:Colp12_sorted_trinity150504_noHs@28369